MDGEQRHAECGDRNRCHGAAHEPHTLGDTGSGETDHEHHHAVEEEQAPGVVEPESAWEWPLGTVGGGSKIGWNFEKFLVDRSGNVVARFGSSTTPSDPALVAAVKTALAGK